MTYRSTDLTAQLRALMDAEPPPSALDLDQARARGRSARNRRRAVGVGGGLAGCALAVALILTLLPGSTYAPTPDTPVSTSPSAVAADPLTSSASFGWLPPGVQQVAVSNGDAGGITAENKTTEFDLHVYQPGDSLPVGWCQPSSSTVCGARAPDVDGHAAFWDTAPGPSTTPSGFVELEWEYAPHAWVLMNATLGTHDSSEIVATVYRVAEGVRFGSAEPVPLPFHLPSAPAGLPGARGTVVWPTPLSADSGDGVTLTFDNSVYYITGAANPDGSELEISISPLSSTFLSKGVPASTPGTDVRQLTLDGRQAVLITTPATPVPAEELLVHEVNGVDLAIRASGPAALSDVDAAGGIVAYFESMKVLGPDPRDWTTDVIG